MINLATSGEREELISLPNLRERRARVGLFMTAGGWFWEIAGDEKKSRYANLAKIVEQAARKIEAKLSEKMQVVSSGIVRNIEEGREAVEKFRQEKVDLIVICNLIWSEDQMLCELLKRVSGTPLVLWCYQMEDKIPDSMGMVELFKLSGPVGTLQASGVIKKSGRQAGFVFGSVSNSNCLSELSEHAEAARLASDLRNAVIGILPYRYAGMMSTYTDEFRMAKEVGPLLRHISVEEYKKRIDRIPDDKVKKFVSSIKKRFKILPEVTEKNLYRSSKISLGLLEVINDFNLDGIAVQDLEPELHETIGNRPCLCVPEIYKRGCVVTAEGEIGACLAMIFQRRFSGRSPMYVEVFQYDLDRNFAIAGHAAMHDIDSLSRGDDSVVITNDYEYDQVNKLKGVWQIFTARPGPVTFLSVVDSKDCFQMTIVRGEALEEGQILFGNPNMNVRFEVGISEFFKQASFAGVTQHWAVAYGDTTGKLCKLASILGMRAVTIGKQR